MPRPRSRHISLAVFPLILASVLLGAASALLGVCGPFTDVAADAFCPFVLEVFSLGITTGTTPTTYDPSSAVSRLQMAAFLSRTVDGVVKRGGQRAALNRLWSTNDYGALALTSVGSFPAFARFDGADVWVSNQIGNSVSRVRASDGKLLETWTGASQAYAVLSALGRVFVTSFEGPGKLYVIDPSQPPGGVTTVATTTNLGNIPTGITFDGSRIWTANNNFGVSIIQPMPNGDTVSPWTVTNVTAGFAGPMGAIYDGANVWITDNTAGTLLKLDSSASVIQTVTVGTGPSHPASDGTNLWVPLSSNQLVVVRAATGAVLRTLTGNGMNNAFAAAFDGERILVTNLGGGLSLWKATDLTSLGSFSTFSTGPYGVCSDGMNFWIALNNIARLARF